MKSAWLDVKEITDAIAGPYEMPDGTFDWIDRKKARNIALRIADASKKKAENLNQCA